MDDRRLQRLVRMAAEAEQLDHPAGWGVTVPVRTEPSERLVLRIETRRVSWRVRAAWIGGGLAAAASLAVGAFVMLMPGQGTPPAPIARGESDGSPAIDDLVHRPAEDRPAPTERVEDSTLVAHHPEEEAVLFAVYRGANGSCECVQVNDPDWGAEKRLAEVSRHELLRAGMQEPCTTLAPEVLVIGVAGKPGTVQSSRQHAETIARRLGDQPLRDVQSLAYAAIPDLPAGTVVVAEKMSIRP